VGTYASTANVQSRVPGRTIGASTEPSTTEVSTWIDEAEADLTTALKAAQCNTPIDDADALEVMRKWVCLYAVGMTKKAWASGAADGNDDGEAELAQFEALLRDINADPAFYVAKLSGSGSGRRLVRSHVLDNSDSKTVADGDFDPIFDMDEVF